MGKIAKIAALENRIEEQATFGEAGVPALSPNLWPASQVALSKYRSSSN